MVIKRKVKLSGLRPIMFDRYIGTTATDITPMQRIYLSSKDKKTLVLPSTNIMSFLSSHTTESAPKRIMGKRWRVVCSAAASYVAIDPIEIPFTRAGKTLTIDNAGLRTVFAVPRVRKGPLVIPNPKERPVLDCPWELEFTISLYETNDLTEEMLKRLFEEGGMAIGLGTWRGVYGKFVVDMWKK